MFIYNVSTLKLLIEIKNLCRLVQAFFLFQLIVEVRISTFAKYTFVIYSQKIPQP